MCIVELPCIKFPQEANKKILLQQKISQLIG